MERWGLESDIKEYIADLERDMKQSTNPMEIAILSQAKAIAYLSLAQLVNGKLSNK